MSSTSINRPDPQVLFSPSGKSKLGRKDMLQRYDEWLKIASENKITAKNTWNVALIDYFSDMTLIKDNGEINFQKASCTLDGCVKIYTSRVDSVVDEAGKLLSGLADTPQGEVEISTVEDAKQPKRKTVRNSSFSDTLAKTTEAINMKNIADITTQLDPLFRQMCSAFDEGTRKQGGTAWLMSHLGMNKEGGLIFDTSEEMIDLWEEIKTEDGQESRICINIEEKFREGLRGSENSAFFKQAMLSTSRNEHVEVEAVIHEVEGDQGWEDFGEVEGTDSGLFEEEETSPISLTAQVMKSLERASELTSDPMSEQSSPLSEPEGRMDEFQMTADALSNLSFTNEDTNSLQFRYFDKSWAGPEHWKMGHLKLGSNTASAPKKERKAKIKSKFDFTMAKEVDIRSLFMKPTNPNTLRMSLEENTYVTCLPEDLGIKAESILTLFTKSIVKLGVTAKKSSKFQYNENCGIPKKAIIDGSSRDALEIFRDPKVLFCDSIEAGNGGFDDGSFDDGGNDSFHDATLQESPLGAPSQEFSRISLSGHISDLDSQAGNTPFVKPQFTAISTLQYSRTAKTIDVGLLKTSLLSSIKKSIEDNNLSRSASNATTLGKVLADLPETVIKRDEVARVHFGFMALLHLANEQGLTLRSTTNLNDITISMYN